MGFGDLFARHGPTVHAKAKLTQGLAGWLNATIATVQAAAPEMRKTVYSALWAEVDSTKELTPLTAAELQEQVRLSLVCERVGTQKCNPTIHSTFCACGGVPGDPISQVTTQQVSNKACPPNRNLCRNALCPRHGGEQKVEKTTIKIVAAPLCTKCNGTGIIARSGPMQYIRDIYDEQQRIYPRPSTPLHEWILYEGQEACMVPKRCNWHHKFYAGYRRCRPDDDDVDNSTWMAAAQIMYDNEALRIYFPHDQYTPKVGLDGGKQAYGRWSDLPPSKYMCDQVFTWWHKRNTPGFKSPESTLTDFVKPILGKCTIPIERSATSTYCWQGNVPKGDFNHFMACADSLQSSLEEFMEVFYDCAAQFDGNLEFTLNNSKRLSAVSGTLGGVQIRLNVPQETKPKKFGDSLTDLSHLYSTLMNGQKFGPPILRGHPDREEIEDQLDHLENKQGGELISTPSFTKMLKDKRKEVRGKEFVEGSEGKLVRSSDLTLSKGDIFFSHTALEKEKEVPIKMPSFDLEPVPRTQPVVRTFTGKEMQTPLNKAHSMRVGNFAAFRAGNIPIGRHVDNTEEAIKYMLGRASTSTVQEPSLGQPRMCASDDVQKFCFIQNIILPTSVTQGTILGSIEILDKMRSTNSISNAHWLSQGYVDTDIRIVSHLASNSFTGLALWFILDAWQALPTDIGTTFDANLIRLLPCHTQILGDVQSSTYVLNFRKLLGQTLHFGGDGFAKPILYIVAATTSTLPWSTSGSFAVEGFSTGERFSPGLASDFELEYPIPPSSLEDLDLVLLPRSQALGEITNMVIPLNLATKTSSTVRYAYPYAAGLLSHFLGIGGDMRFRIDILSSAFVTATLRVALWHEEVSSAEMAMIPHVTTMTGVEVNLKIQTPFYSTSNFGDSGAKMIIQFLSSPLAPSTVQSAFEYQIHILGIKADIKLCKQINYSQRFGWFMIANNNRTPANFAICLPARRVNMTHRQGTFTNLLNSFAIMCATTGMHWGKVIIHFQWSLTHSTPLAELRGHATISTGMGEKDLHRGQINEYNMLDTSAAIPFEFCSFAGPTPSRKIDDEGDNWIIFSTPAWSNITSLYVSIEVLPGFRFYGRRAGPYAAV